MPRHSPYALIRLNFLLLSSLDLLLNCLSFLNISFFGLLILVKRFYPFAWIFYSTFRWNCNFTQIGKTYNFFANLVKNYLSSYLFVSYSSILFIRFSMNIILPNVLAITLFALFPTRGLERFMRYYLVAWLPTLSAGGLKPRISLQRTASYMLYIEALRFDPLRTLFAWWAQVDSNHRPRAYQARALTTWAMSPFSFSRCISFTLTFFFRLTS